MQANKIDSYSSPNIRKFTFSFPCDQPLEINPNGIKLFGIGGKNILIFFYKIKTSAIKTT